MNRIAVVSVVLALVVVAGWGAVRALERSMIFIPDSELVADPGELGLTFEDLDVSIDRDRLHGWWVQTPRDPRRGVVLFFHGNAGNISHRLHTVQFWTDAGFDIVIFDYRGYGRSTGRATEENAYADGRAMWEYLTESNAVPAEDIIIQGRSLGGGISSHLASQVTPRAYIIESSFTSIPAIAKDLMPWIPKWIVRTRMDTLSRIGSVACPVLVAHARGDEVIGYHHGRALFDAAPEPKQFIELDGGHNGNWVQTPHYPQEVDDFLVRIAGIDP